MRLITNHRWIAVVMAIVALVAVACGTSAEPQAAPVASTTVPIPSPSTPVPATDARDTVVLVTGEEPTTLGALSDGCSGNVPSMVCEEVASDPFTWIDTTTFEVVSLTGVEGWSQEAPNRWRFNLREGVTFHNGEAWNAAAAKVSIDWSGDSGTAGHGMGTYGFHGGIQAEVVDNMTVDIVCDIDCPILPRTTIFLKFQAPEWWTNASEDERESMTVGLGPYKVVNWKRGVEIELEAYEDYKPNSSFGSQAPSIKHAFQVWRNEGLVRASMVAAGEADLAFEIGIANRDIVPRVLTGTNNEVVLLVADNIWHPELKKQKVREALALAIDCEGLMEAIYEDLQSCYGTVSQFGTVGVTLDNSAPYGYDTVRAKELLDEAGYDPENEIIIYTREGRFYNDVELVEAVVGQWREIGVNAKSVIMEGSKHQEVRRSGCGRFEDRKCVGEEPPEPFFASSHFYLSPTSNESMDMQRQLLLRNSCGNVNSRVCDLVPGFEDAIQEAVQTPLGPERTRKMEELTNTIRDEVYFIPFFEVVTVYGLAEDLVWTPRYDPRTRINTMSFK
jgi:peptide/nickel transport system substrate-binding protein